MKEELKDLIYEAGVLLDDLVCGKDDSKTLIRSKEVSEQLLKYLKQNESVKKCCFDSPCSCKVK